MAPKKKGNTMSLSDFASMVQTEVPNAPKSSWADEDIELPSAPMGNFEPVQQSTGGYDRSFVTGTDRSGRGGRDNAPPPPPVIDYGRLPTAGPFICFVGNLPFDVSEADIRSCFPEVSITNVKIPKDPEMRGRGFAYINLADQDSLIKALLCSGASLKGRFIRVDISEGRQSDFKETSFASDWRGGVEHQVSERSGRPNFDRPDIRGGPERVFDRSSMSPVVAEPRNTGAGWRTTAQPVVVERPKSTASENSFRSAPTPVQAPPKRPVLNLQPRSKPLGNLPEPAQVYAQKGGSNPFGTAKPVDKPVVGKDQ